MRNSLALTLGVACLLLLGTGCDTLVTLDKPTVTTEAISSGGTLRLTWTAVTDAESYEVKTPETTYTVTATSVDIATPTTSIEVRAVNGNDKSDPATIDCGLVETPPLTLYDRSDPDPQNPSGLGFKSDGTALAYAIVDANRAAIDYVVDSMVGLYNSGNYGWTQNVKGNALQDAGVTVFKDAKLAPAAGNYWTGMAIAGNGVYYLWLDPTDNNWSTDDHYAKMKVDSWEQATKKLVVKFAYQKIGGLRWLVN